MDKPLEMIGEFGLVPIVKIENADDALSLGRALIEGGLPVAEITFRTGAAEESIGILTQKMPDLLVGAGTVLTIDQVKKALSAGAKFIVSPGFNPRVVDYCLENGISVTPGVNSPTELEMALERGLELVKFFPAESSGGIDFLNDMAAPYRGIKFFPTGGINADNVGRYLQHDRVHACGGSWMVKSDLISSGNFDEVIRLVREAVSIILGFEFVHLRINEENEEKSVAVAKDLSQFFHFGRTSGTDFVFAGKGIEITPQSFPGEKGCLGVGVNNLERALAYLKRKGISIIPETAKRSQGKLKSVFIEKQIAGFAIHLLQKGKGL